jgi:predicted ester cyclase
MAMDITKIAFDFFDACETGQGWEACSAYCHDNATFSAQSDAIADVKTLEGYVEWMKGLLVILPDGHYDLKSFSTDANRNMVVACAIFSGTHTGEGGPVPPTNQSASADYVYCMVFEGDRIAHMTKVWNDSITLRELGWS